jgi:hypothetical protein
MNKQTLLSPAAKVTALGLVVAAIGILTLFITGVATHASRSGPSSCWWQLAW